MIADQTDESPWQWELETARARGVVDGEIIPQQGGSLEVLHTPGHTAGSICLRIGTSLITGDHVLPSISPNIGGGDLRHTGLLQRYLHSLQRVADVAVQTGEPFEALPGHGKPFVNLVERCQELRTHHDRRLSHICGILSDGRPRTVYGVALALFGEMREYHLVLGCAEAAAHLEVLEQRDQVREEQGRYIAS